MLNLNIFLLSLLGSTSVYAFTATTGSCAAVKHLNSEGGTVQIKEILDGAVATGLFTISVAVPVAFDDAVAPKIKIEAIQEVGRKPMILQRNVYSDKRTFNGDVYSLYKTEFELAITDEETLAKQNVDHFSPFELKYALEGCEDHHTLEYTIYWKPQLPEFKTTPDMCESVVYRFRYLNERGLTVAAFTGDENGAMLDVSIFDVQVELPKDLLPNDSSMPKFDLWATEELKGHSISRLTAPEVPDSGGVKIWVFCYQTVIVDPEILSRYAGGFSTERIEIPGMPFEDPFLVKIPITYGIAGCPLRQKDLELDLKLVRTRK